jgi:hypothetical protein
LNGVLSEESLRARAVRFALQRKVDRPGGPHDDEGDDAPKGATGVTHRVSLRPCDPRIAFRRAIAAFLFEGPCFRVLGRTNESPLFRTGFRLPSPAPVQPQAAEPRSGPGR